MGVEVMGVSLHASLHNHVIMCSPFEPWARWIFDVMGVSLHASWHYQVITFSPCEHRASWFLMSWEFRSMHHGMIM